MSAPRMYTCTDCGRARPDASGQPIRCGDCLRAADPPVFGIVAAGRAYLALDEAGALTPRVRDSFAECVAIATPPAMHTRTVWHPRGLDRLTPDEAGRLSHRLYVLSGGASKPHTLRMEIVAAADALQQYYAAPKLTPRKREPDTYCFRCGEPVPGGLFIANSRKGGRGFSWVNVDHDADAPHCTPPATAREAIARWLAPAEPTPAFVADGAQLAMFAPAPAPLTCPGCGARRVFSDGFDDPSAERRGYVCDACASTWSVDGAQLDLFSADPVSAPALRAEDL